MSDILRWLYDDEQVDSTPLLTVKIPQTIPEVEINEDIVIDEIERSTYCPKCNMMTTGLPCGMDTDCPW